MIGQPGESAPRQLAIRSRSEAPPHHLQFISSKAPSYDPLSYTLLHMRGDLGWRLKMHSHKLIDGLWQEEETKVVSALDYYRYCAHPRDQKWNRDDPSTYDIDKDILFHGALLTHQYFVDQYIKVEENNLDYIRFNQPKLKAANYRGLADAVAQGEGRQEGTYVVLPSTHPGSPRHQNECYQDAMARVRKYGKPTMFITMTCNPKWREIVDELQPGQECWMRPDLPVRVFKMKLDSFMKDITKDGYMGRAVSHIHVIEFQKRGLPTVDDFDKYACAEIPNSATHPRLDAIITKNMLHGPCDHRYKNESGDCTKIFED